MSCLLQKMTVPLLSPRRGSSWALMESGIKPSEGKNVASGRHGVTKQGGVSSSQNTEMKQNTEEGMDEKEEEEEDWMRKGAIDWKHTPGNWV